MEPRTTMRHLTPLVLAVLLLTAHVTTAPGQDREAVPQDPARQQQRLIDALRWNQRTLNGAYEKVGKKNPRWDKSAREVLEALAGLFSRSTDPAPTLEDVYPAAEKAVTAGCDDPLILYAYARTSVGSHYPGSNEYQRRLSTAAAALERSEYPAFRRAVALHAAGWRLAVRSEATPETRKEASRLLDAALALLPESLAKDERSPELESIWHELAWKTLVASTRLGIDSQAAFDQLDAKLAKIPDAKALRLQVRGVFFIDYAWQTRGTGLAFSVPEERGRLFAERIDEAGKALEACWTLKPGDVRSATSMLKIETAGKGDRASMETWFTRAMEADGDNLEACRTKIDWLDPKWHGSVDEMLEFGRACRDTKNWRAGLPLILPEAHHRAVMFQPGPVQFKYFSEPNVWNDIRSVYDEYLSHHPKDHLERSRYASLAYLCGKPEEAHRQFEAVGENLVWERTFPEQFVKQARKLAALHVNNTKRTAARAARKGAPVKLEPTKGFRPLALAWEDPQGETGVLKNIDGCLTTDAGVDVLWSGKDVFLLKDPQRATRVHANRVRNRRHDLTNASFDGKYVWFSAKIYGEPASLLVLDPATGKTMTVTTNDGLPGDGPKEPVPDSQTLAVTAIEPGKACVAGILQSRGSKRAWIATVSVDPQGGKSVRVFHEAKEPVDRRNPDQWQETTVVFSPDLAVTLTAPPSDGNKPTKRVLVFRTSSFELAQHPLLVDPDAGTVEVVPAPIDLLLRGIPQPGSFTVHQGRFYWIDFKSPGSQGTLMSFGLNDPVPKPVVRTTEIDAGTFLIAGNRVDIVGQQWSVASLTEGAVPRALALTLPWVEQLEVNRAGLFRSRHLGVLVKVMVSGSPNVTLQVEVPAGPRSMESQPIDVARPPSIDPGDLRADRPSDTNRLSTS
jgi:hypothetical protein